MGVLKEEHCAGVKPSRQDMLELMFKCVLSHVYFYVTFIRPLLHTTRLYSWIMATVMPVRHLAVEVPQMGVEPATHSTVIITGQPGGLKRLWPVHRKHYQCAPAAKPDP